MGRRTNILRGVVEDQVFEMHKLAIDPERGAGIGKMRPPDPALPTGERAIRSSRRVNADPASENGRSKLRMGNFARS